MDRSQLAFFTGSLTRPESHSSNGQRPICESLLLPPRALPSLSASGSSASLHLLLNLVGVHVHSRGHLHGLATAAADVLEEAQVGAARHDDRDDDDDGGAEGRRHGVLQDRLEAPQADPA